MLNDITARTSIANSQIYSGVTVLAQSPHTTGADWALVRLDRPVPDLLEGESRVAQCLLDVTVGVAAVGEPAPWALEAVLPAAQRG